jgi:hypothetical protein
LAFRRRRRSIDEDQGPIGVGSTDVCDEIQVARPRQRGP